MARVLGLVVILATITLAAAPVRAQAPSPPGAPLPHDDYLVRIEDVRTASDAAFARLGPTTPAEIAAAFGEMMVIGASDLVAMREVAPEPCYAAAHGEILAYRESVIEITEPLLPLIAESETMGEVLEVIEQIDAELHARHSVAYTEAPDAQLGFGGSYRNILAALATCEPGAILDPIPETRRIEFPAERVAITLSTEWQAIEPAVLDLATMLGGYRSARHGTCLVQQATTAPITLDEVLDEVPTGYWADLADGYSMDRVETAAGAAARVTFWEGRADLEARFWNAIYLVPTAEGLFSVQCTAEDGVHVAPADDWFSIAESFELVPRSP